MRLPGPAALFRIVVLCAVPCLAAAQDASIVGSVTDTRGSALVGANVRVLGTVLGATTDAEGRFSIPRVPAGMRTLRVTMLGYETADTALTVGGPASAPLTMPESRTAI